MAYRVFHKNKDAIIKDVKAIGQMIIDNAEEIVGDYQKKTAYTIIGKVSISTVPTLEWTKEVVVIPNANAEVIEESED